ncbi:hypothetical protein M080_5090 [Bacteroides fragilis str. 3397 T10]|nr:hypothetical protein M080_5090 [Bacteroides fragilis str. 3397 T10]
MIGKGGIGSYCPLFINLHCEVFAQCTSGDLFCCHSLQFKTGKGKRPLSKLYQLLIFNTRNKQERQCEASGYDGVNVFHNISVIYRKLK